MTPRSPAARLVLEAFCFVTDLTTDLTTDPFPFLTTFLTPFLGAARCRRTPPLRIAFLMLGLMTAPTPATRETAVARPWPNRATHLVVRQSTILAVT